MDKKTEELKELKAWMRIALFISLIVFFLSLASLGVAIFLRNVFATICFLIGVVVSLLFLKQIFNFRLFSFPSSPACQPLTLSIFSMGQDTKLILRWMLVSVAFIISMLYFAIAIVLINPEIAFYLLSLMGFLYLCVAIWYKPTNNAPNESRHLL